MEIKLLYILKTHFMKKEYFYKKKIYNSLISK